MNPHVVSSPDSFHEIISPVAAVRLPKWTFARVGTKSRRETTSVTARIRL